MELHTSYRTCSREFEAVSISICHERIWKRKSNHTKYTCYFRTEFLKAVVAEWLRRWTRNPLGSARAGSNPADCACFALSDPVYVSNTCADFRGIHPLTVRQLCTTVCTAVVAEWLRRWTRNPLGSARTGSNPVGSDHFESIYSVWNPYSSINNCLNTHSKQQLSWPSG